MEREEARVDLRMGIYFYLFIIGNLDIMFI